MKRKLQTIALFLALCLILPGFTYGQDVGVFAIVSPQSGDCGANNIQVMVKIVNYDATVSSSNFPVSVSITGSASFSATDTFKSTLKPGDSAFFTINTTVSTRNGGTFNVKAYTALSGDVNTANDTLTSVAAIQALPTPPTATGAIKCGFGQLTLTSHKTATDGSDYWYADSTSGTALGSGDTFLTSYLTKTTTFFARTALPKVDTAETHFADTSRANNGNMFNIIATSNFRVDSFALNCFDNSKLATQIYYKLGSYAGYQNKASAWTLLGTDTLAGVGLNKPTICPIGGLNMVKGQTYGIYVNRISTGTNGVGYDEDTFVMTKPDMKIQSGCSLGGTFGSYVNRRAWNGIVYYSKPSSCGSYYTPAVATIKQGVNGVTLKEGSQFSGTYNSGAYNDPDAICQDFTSIYDITPPAGLSNSTYGTIWTITFDTVRTLSGKKFIDTAFIAPNSSSDGMFEITPDSASTGDDLIITGRVTILSTGCDSSFKRFIYFTVSNACQASGTGFTNTTKFKSGTLTYVWSFGDGQTSTDVDPVHVYKNSGTYYVKLTAFTTNGCEDTASGFVTVNPAVNLKPVITGGCANLTTYFADSSTLASGTYTVVWNFGDTSTTSNSKNTSHTYANLGNHTLSLIATTNLGCSDTIEQNINVIPGPVSSFKAGASCQDQSTSFTNTSTIASGTITSSMWRFGDTTATSSTTSPVHTFMNAGSHTVTLISTSATGCMDSVSKSISVNDHPTAAFGYAGGCLNQAVQFSDSSSIADNSTLTYHWDFGDKLAPSTAQSPSHSYSLAGVGTYNVQLEVFSGSGCEGVITKAVKISLPPKANFTVSNVCFGEPASFSNNSTPSTGVTYSWDFGNGVTIDSVNPSYTYPKTGIYKVILTAYIGTCTDTFSQMVTVSPAANAVFTDKVSNLSVSFTSKDTTQTSYAWNFGDGNSSTAKNPTHVFTASGTYGVTLVVTNSSNCVASSTDSVTVSPSGIENLAAQNLKLDVHPNPFQDATTIQYSLENASQIKVEVYDMAGKQVALLANERQVPGVHSYIFDANKYNAAAGAYLVKISVDNALVRQQIIRIQ